MRASFLVLLIGAALCASATPASSASDENSTTATAAPLSFQLAEALYPKELLPAFSPNFASQFAQGMRNSEQGARMEKLFPGFCAEFARRALPEIRAITLTRLPTLRKGVAAIYKANLSPSEQAEYLTFVRSPAGRALIAGIAESYDIQTLTQSIVKNGGKATSEVQDQQLELVALGLRTKMSEADTAELKRFFDTAIGRKVVEIEPKTNQLLTDFANQRDPAAERRLNEIALAVARDMARKAK